MAGTAARRLRTRPAADPPVRPEEASGPGGNGGGPTGAADAADVGTTDVGTVRPGRPEIVCGEPVRVPPYRVLLPGRRRSECFVDRGGRASGSRPQ
ncbi:hypothetical protein [Pseudonocardia sp.]|uniref:hypothetical protein n=1 Tax=Pseudonocardia sp. TaxID=60912 RepID=UPI00261E36C9|nr:hypothetical protein [Pseudonocardia sp.]